MNKKSPVETGLFYLTRVRLFTLTRSVNFQTITHVGMEVLQSLVFIALSGEWFGANLLVTTAIATMQ